MNRAYRLVWSAVAGAFVAVAEFVRARGKRASAALLCSAAGVVLAGAPALDRLPTGGNVKQGDASIATSGSRMDVVQRTDRAVIEWTSFDIGRDARVNFAQPGAGSVVLNRVLDSQPSQIFGGLTANGQVFLVNPNGVYFSPTARVDVGGLVASSGRISDEDFARGQWRFEAGEGAGAVVNEGRLQAAAGGYVALLAPEVRNTGAVVAELGTVALAAGGGFDLRFDGERSLAAVRITPAALAALVDNGGVILAGGGRVILSAHAANELQGGVVRSSGAVAATGISVGPGGRILLEASHDVQLGGELSAAADGAGGSVRVSAGRRLDAASATVDVHGATGGEIVLEGGRIELSGTTTIDARGLSGGGQVAIGGGVHGSDAGMTNADFNRVGAQVAIHADAVERGDGGQVVVWSNQVTAFSGQITARGGQGAGNGGFVEVSSGERLGFAGHVDAGASNGAAGRLLLDPKNLVISTAAQTDGLTGGLLDFATNASGNSVINPATITAVTNTGTAVQLQASNDLSVESNIVTQNLSGIGGDIDLTAGRSVTINALINTDGGDLRVTANAPVASGVIAGERDAGAAQLTNNGIVVAVGGDVTFRMDTGAGHAGTSGSISTGAVVAGTLTVPHAGPTAGGTIDVGSTSVKQLTVTSGSARDITNNFGDITVHGALGASVASFDAAGGNVTLTGAANDFDVLAVAGNNVVVNDLNGIQIGASTVGGNLQVTAHGPIEGIGAVSVTGATTLAAIAMPFGIDVPDITFGAANSFQGPVRIVSGMNVVVKNQGDLVFGGGASAIDGTLSAISVAGSISSASPITVQEMVSLAAQTDVVLGAPLVTLQNVDIVAGGNIAVGAVGAFSDINMVAGGNVTAGALTVPVVTAAAGGDIALGDAGNNVEGVAVIAGRDATIANSGDLSIDASTIGRDLNVSVAGNILPGGALEVGRNALFTVSTAGADLSIGNSGNLFAGTVTMATAGAGSYRDVAFANSTPVAAMPMGFPVAGLHDVSLEFSQAPSFAVPSMTLSGKLTVSLPLGNAGPAITQAPGGVRLAPGQLASFSTSVDGDIVLTDAGNQFQKLEIVQGHSASVAVAGGPLELGVVNLGGDLQVSAGGTITQGAPASVGGSASFAVGGNDLTLDQPGNAWNIVRIGSANDVLVATTTDLSLGATNVTGSFRAEVPDAHVAGPAALSVAVRTFGEAVQTAGATTFRNFTTVDLGSANNRFGALDVQGVLLPASVRVREDDAITQAASWVLPDVPVELIADNNKAILLTQAGNVLGDLRIVGGAASVREADAITQGLAGGGWLTTGTTTLDAAGHDIVLKNANNQMGALAIGAGATSVDLRENDDITQAAAWSLATTPIRLDAGINDVVLDRAGNQLGALSPSAQNLTVVENHAVTQGAAWTIAGTTQVDAGANDIDLTHAGNDFATVGLATTGNARVVDANAVVLGSSAVGGRLTLTAGGAITQAAGVAAGTFEATSTAQIRLDRADNAIDRVGNVLAVGGIELQDAASGIAIDGVVKTTGGGDVHLHTEGGDLTLSAGGGVEIRGVGNAILAAGVGHNFVNLNTGGIPAVLVDSGRYLIYTASQAGVVKGNLTATTLTGFTYAGNPPGTIPGVDNRFLAADLHMLLITARNVTRTYGDANPIFSYTVSGLNPGDTASGVLTGAPTLSTVAGAGADVGTYTIDIVPGSLVSRPGYSYTLVQGDLTILPRPIVLTGSRVYDGTRAVDLSTLAISGLVAGQELTLGGNVSLVDAGVGANKPMDLSGLTVGNGAGGNAANYTLAGARYNVVSALTGLPTENPPPQAEPSPAPVVSTASYRELAGEDDIYRRLSGVGGPILLAGDLRARPVTDVPAPLVVAAAPAPEVVPAATSEPAPVARSAPPVDPTVSYARTDRPLPPLSVTSKRTIVFGADESFLHGESALTPAGRALIEREVVKPVLGGYPVASIVVTGHTDPTGSDAFNEKLSRRRAEAGRDYLVRRGVKPGLVRAEGRGSRQPAPGLACTLSDLACLAPERRLEIQLTPLPAPPLVRK